MRASEALAAEGLHLKQWLRGTHRLACPKCGKGKRDTALSVKIEADGHAVWTCHRCHWSGTTKSRQPEQRDGRWQRRSRRNGPPQRPAVEPEPPQPAGEPEDEPVAFGEAQIAFWRRCLPITEDCPVGRYLISKRWCHLPPDGADLLWTPELRHPYCKTWSGPAMIGLITHAVTRQPMSFHITWIQPDGSDKAPLGQPRLLAKGLPKKEGVIRLCDDAEVTYALAVGEGIESTLAFGRMTGHTALWAAIDAGNLAVLPVLPVIQCLMIVADHDKVNPKTGQRAGIVAAAALAERWRRFAPDLEDIDIFLPPNEGQDANDVAVSRIAS
jgi:hypothetical protein